LGELLKIQMYKVLVMCLQGIIIKELEEVGLELAVGALKLRKVGINFF
jgi:hypothetical protein